MFWKLLKWAWQRKNQYIYLLILFAIVSIAILTSFFIQKSICFKIALVILVLIIFFMLGYWVSFVIVPRSQLRKTVPEKYIRLQKQFKTSMKPQNFAELAIYAESLVFELQAIVLLIFPIVFITLSN